jgi:uncharacterized protein YuzE
MRFRYSEVDDALYIEVRDGRPERQVELDPGTLVDVDANGRLIGIEVIAPDAGWPADEILRRFPVDPDDAAYIRELAGKSFAFSHARGSSTADLQVVDRTA